MSAPRPDRTERPRDGGGMPTRPVVRWHGAKWMLAPWIIAHFPAHRVYTESFGGGASVLLRKPRAYAEVYSDLDGEIVTLFEVLRDEATALRLIEVLRLTPFARAEFLLSYQPATDPVERARRTVVRSFMGHGSDSASGIVSGFRANTSRRGTTPSHDWMNLPDALGLAIRRLQGVVIEQRDAIAIISQHDSPRTLHYIDPPYLRETRAWMTSGKGKGNYRHELDTAGHVRLLEFLPTLAGMVVLSGYPSTLYDTALTGWRRVEKATYADGARPRTEVLWLNPQAGAALDAGRTQGEMFAGGRAS